MSADAILLSKYKKNRRENAFREVESTREVYGEKWCIFRAQNFSGALRNTGKSIRELCGTVSGPEKFSGLLRNAHLEGKKTCFHYNGSSVVDYVIGSKSILRKVQYLIVNPLMPHLSDHCHLSFAIKANLIDRDSFETSAELTLTENNRLFWNIKSKDRLKDGLKSQLNSSIKVRSSCKTW